MAGLLYKDFVAVHGKIHTVALLALTVALGLFSASPLPAVGDYNGAVMICFLVFIMSMTLPLTVGMSITGSLIAVDEGARKKAYLFSLPVNKRQYVASKYIFILICYYVTLSVIVLWVQFASIFSDKASMGDLLAGVSGLAPLWIQVLLMLNAVELPFLIVKGTRMGGAIKTTILAMLMYAIFGFMLFGDISFLDSSILLNLANWMEANEETLMVLQVIGPVIVGILYYLSYRISVACLERKEQEDEE